MVKFSGSTIRKGVAGAGVGALLIATPFVGQWEGLRTEAYLDPVGIPTICYGHTRGVEIGDQISAQECHDLLTVELREYLAAVDDFIYVDMPDTRRAALTSFAYNVGIENFKRSTLRRKMNEGKTQAACEELRRWVFAKGKFLSGLKRRREAEYRLCVDGLPEGV